MKKKGKKKWTWRIGQKPPPLDPHSYIKHLVVRDYLRRYIDVLMANQRIPQLKLTLVDGFAGGGLYSDDHGNEQPGSPLLLIDTVKQAQHALNADRHSTFRHIDAQYHFVEIEGGNFAYLSHVLKERGHLASAEGRIFLHKAAFSDVAESIIKSAASRLGGQRALFLLDQYNYKAVDFRLIKRIFTSLQGSEVLLTFNVDSLTSFLSDTPQSRKIAGRIGLEDYIDWTGIRLMKARGQYHELIQRELAGAMMKACGARFMTLFFITPAGASPWSYWLVHMSNAYKANDVMKEVHWHYGNAFGHSLEPGVFKLGYRVSRDPTVTGQDGLFFDTPAAFDADLRLRSLTNVCDHLRQTLRTHDSGISFDNIVVNLANHTNATAAMVRESLMEPIATGEILAMNKAGGQRRKSTSIAKDDILMRSSQRVFSLL